jgi:hypothetical protein
MQQNDDEDQKSENSMTCKENQSKVFWQTLAVPT